MSELPKRRCLISRNLLQEIEVIHINIREAYELKESQLLSEYASLSSESKGRSVEEAKCDIRTEYQRDRDRILHSKSFRRLKHKTQVFIAPEGDHFRTRLTHTLEVAQIGRTIARALSLNEDLIEAIALGHDLGHTPFGHSGEYILDKLHPNGFKHYEQSIRVVEIIESTPTRRGLNLTYEVLDGIRNHSGDRKASTLEGKIIKLADRIAYINHDIDDSIRAGIISIGDLPVELTEVLGTTHSKRINKMITDIVYNSLGKDDVSMSREVGTATEKLRKYLFDEVYYNSIVKSEDDKIENILTQLFNYYMADLNRIPSAHRDIYSGLYPMDEDIVCDYIAGMTDIFVIETWKDIFQPKQWR